MTRVSPRARSICRFLVLLGAIGLVAANGMAFIQAWAFTHFSGPGERTSRPESLGRAARIKVLFTGVRLPKPTDDADPSSVGLAFSPERIEVGEGVELAIWQVPSGGSRGTVLMFHGYAGSMSALLPEARVFHDLGYSLLMVDFRGSGGSSERITTAGAVEADDVAAVFAALGDAPRPFIAYGKSMGSAAILRAVALDGVRPDAAVLECPFDTLLHTVEHRFEAMDIPSFPMAWLLVFWGGAQHGFSGFSLAPRAYAQAMANPVLLLHGDHDPRVTPAEARTIFDNFPGKKRLVLFPAGHESFLAADPALWRSEVASFLDPTSAQGSLRQ